MTGLRTRLGRALGRTGVGMVAAVAAALLVAPLAAATPESDADAAITQAWDAGGGEGGPLGIKNGGVYPAGAGFGQDFAGGKIYFTPDTGAHAMQGAILDEYQALGGAADGDLGFPTIDEGDGKAPGSRNTTFSAADRPVIFWTPDTGAHVVRGAINAAWDKLGGSAGVLGVPTDDEVYGGDEVTQSFTGGQVTWNGTTKAFTTTPPELAEQLTGLEIPGDVTTAIAAARRAAGGPLGPLGATDGNQYDIGANGVGQNYAGGKIYYSPATGAKVLTGQVLAKYEGVGGPDGDLGFPTSNENDGGLAPMSKIASFAAADQPVIFWTPDFGAVIVRGAMNAAWAKLGGATGELGAPTADQTENGDVVTQKFNGGAITWNRSTNEFTTEPPSLQSQLKGLEVPGGGAVQAQPAAQGTSDRDSTWFRPNAWWLLGILPVLVLVGVVAAAVVRNRRRSDDRGTLDEFDDDYDYRDFDDADADPDERDFDSGPIAQGDDGDSRRSGWAMPADGDDDELPDRGDESEHDSYVADLSTDQDAINTAPTLIVGATGAQPDGPWFTDLAASDDADMVPHRDDEAELDREPVPEGESDLRSEHEADPDYEEPSDPDSEQPSYPDSEPPSGRHAAIRLTAPLAAETSLRLATDDPFDAPRGYPIKADTKTGLYWIPGSGQYDVAQAEIWFASEEFALTNGFIKG
ncbi:LGFP repeat-containing protein [Mycolicibacterium hodleri]|uniref:Transmembrane alanine and glycine rich protein n=1 Tax=Mycolicibacterium hodleri TaxID=49897 RepID=A0A502EJ79_9MYCO|nr:hypothetical protein [Mycolicibacterium hodleri]TPG37032.1 hypothetical protein EAH80_03955 [Mycolicibacterium hodleri]